MYRRRMQGWLKHLDFMLQELLCFQIAFYIACFIRHGWSIPYAVVLYRNTAVVVLLLQIFVIISLNIFKDVLWRGYYNEFKSTVKTVLYVMLLFVFYLFLIQQGGKLLPLCADRNGRVLSDFGVYAAMCQKILFTSQQPRKAGV